MAEKSEPYYYESIIDMRELIDLQLQYKWYTIATAILMAVAVFLVSNFLLTPEYDASAFVTIIEPSIVAELDPRVQVSPSLPDANSLSGLAEADAIINEVVRELNYEDIYQEDMPDVEATLQGNSQLRLKVTTESPQRSEEIANKWAEILVRRLNNIYGTGELRITEIEQEVDVARENWISSQQELEAYLPQSKVDVLEVQLSEERRRLNQYLNQIGTNENLVRDVQALESRLTEKDPTSGLSFGDWLSLIALQQRTTGGIQGTMLQLSSEQITAEDFMISNALEITGAIIASIEDQIAELENKVDSSEELIVDLTVDLESEKHKLERLIQDRDLDRNAYQALANQLEETRITQSQNVKTAQIAAEAMVPMKPSGPNVLINTAIAGFLGLFFSISVIFVYDWYKNE